MAKLILKNAKWFGLGGMTMRRLDTKGNYVPIEFYLFTPAFIIALIIATTYGILSGIIAFFAVIGIIFVLAYILDKIDELRRAKDEEA